jgi:hypothetical protein
MERKQRAALALTGGAVIICFGTIAETAQSIDPATTNPATLNRLTANRTHHLHGTPLAWASMAHGQMHFCGGENGNLRAWQVAPNKSSVYLACSAATASQESPFSWLAQPC